MNDVMLLSEAARVLGIPYMTVYNNWRSGKIPYERHGRWVWVRVADVSKAMVGYRRQELATPVVREEYARQ